MDAPLPLGSYVAVSEIAVAPEGAAALETAFKARLRAVEAWPGFLGLEVLRHRRRPGSYLMISRWTSKDTFQTYMRSAEHDTSHARIPGEPHRPRPAGFSDYDVVAT